MSKLVPTARTLGIEPTILALTIGISVHEINEIIDGEKTLPPDSPNYGRASILSDLLGSLLSRSAGDVEAGRSWLRRFHPRLAASPLAAMQSIEGFIKLATMLVQGPYKDGLGIHISATGPTSPSGPPHGPSASRPRERRGAVHLAGTKPSRSAFIEARPAAPGIKPRDTAMRKELQQVVKDTAAVGLSAAAAGLEIGSELARRTLDEVSRKDPASATPPDASPTPAPPAAEPLDENTKIRAYQLWEKAGCPEGRDQEFYFKAEQEQRDREKPDRPRASDLIA